MFGYLTGYLGVSPVSTESLWVWFAAFIAYDFCYYWFTGSSSMAYMWASHVAHHQSEEFNLSTALRQTGTDYIGFVFYIPLYLAGLPVEVVVTVGSLNLIYQFWVHTEHVRRLGVYEWLFVTPPSCASCKESYLYRQKLRGFSSYGTVLELSLKSVMTTLVITELLMPCVVGIRSGQICTFGWIQCDSAG